MSNLLQSAAAWLGTQLQAAAGVDVIYSRSAATSDPLTATPSQHEYTVVDDDGIGLSVTSYDWTFTRAELTIDGIAVNPRPGDRITASLGVFEVAPLGKRHCSEWLDTSGILILVHTKRVGE